MQHFDITLIGGGMVGLALAKALAELPIKIALINRQPLALSLTDEPELRVSAINRANRLMFEKMGIWQHIEHNRSCDYHHMHVWDQDSFGAIEFDAQSLNLEQLGTIVENNALSNALALGVYAQDNVTVFENAQIKQLSLGDSQHAIIFDQEEVENGQFISSSLVVGTDGAQSMVRKTCDFPMNSGEYGQTAIVATIRSELPHGKVARQVFTPFGPLALLPLADEHLCSIVWSQDSAQANTLLALSDDEFNKQLSVVSNHSLGLLSIESERKSFLLTKQYARKWVRDGVVLCGDAAHTIHPLAGQGANLGFEDAWMLADTIKTLVNSGDTMTNGKVDFHSAHHYRPYERARKTSAVAMLSAMETFHQVFTGSNTVKKGLRGLALSVANQFTPVKNALAKEALGI